MGGERWRGRGRGGGRHTTQTGAGEERWRGKEKGGERGRGRGRHTIEGRGHGIDTEGANHNVHQQETWGHVVDLHGILACRWTAASETTATWRLSWLRGSPCFKQDLESPSNEHLVPKSTRTGLHSVCRQHVDRLYGSLMSFDELASICELRGTRHEKLPAKGLISGHPASLVERLIGGRRSPPTGPSDA